MTDREALQLQADALQARMDAIADLSVRMTEEKLLIVGMQEKLNTRFDELHAEKAQVERQITQALEDELM